MAWKKIPYTSFPVHLVKDGGEQHGSEHKRMNPMGQLPVLLVDGTPISQSLAILEYLEETHPFPALLPKDPLARAKARQMAEVINSGIQPIQNLSVMQDLSKNHDFTREKTIAWSGNWIARGFEALETLAIEVGGRYSSGNHVTIADVCLVPQLYNGRRFGVDMERFPTLLRIENELNALDAFNTTRPENQADAP